jgi:hypothetical protein
MAGRKATKHEGEASGRQALHFREYIYSPNHLGPEFSAGLRLPGGFEETVKDFSLSFGAAFVF